MSQPPGVPQAKPGLVQRGKERTAQRAAPLIAQAVGPDERVWAGARIESGLSQWWILLSTYAAMFRKYRYMALTDNHVVLCKISFWTGRPTKVESVTPRNQVRVSDYRPGRVFATFMFVVPGRDRATRVRVPKLWRPEIEYLLGQIGALGPASGTLQQPYSGQQPYAG